MRFSLVLLCVAAVCGCARKEEVAEDPVIPLLQKIAGEPLRLPKPTKSPPGLYIECRDQGFGSSDPGGEVDQLRCFARIVNHTNKVWKNIKISATVLFPGDAKPMVGYLNEFRIVPSGGPPDMLAPGQVALSQGVTVPIGRDHWRLGYSTTMDVVEATELDPKLSPGSIDARIAMMMLGDVKGFMEQLDKHPEFKDYVGPETGFSVMDMAIEGGSVDLVKALLARGMKIEELDSRKRCPLCFAAQGSPEMVRYILKSHPANLPDQQGNYPLEYAIQERHIETAAALMDAGIPVNDIARDHFGAMFSAIFTQSKEMVDFVGRRKVPVDRVYKDMYPLDYAISMHDLDILDTVYKYDQGVNRPTPHRGLTAIHFAVLSEVDHFAEWCIAHGADLKARTKDGKDVFALLPRVRNDMDRMRMKATLEGRPLD